MRTYEPLPKSFTDKIAETPNGHWVWAAAKMFHTANGVKYTYAAFLTYENGKEKRTLAHRVSYSLLVRPLSPNEHLTNTCGITTCVNPDHWSIASMTTERKACRNGHPITLETLKVQKNNKNGTERIVCRTCSNEARKRHYHQNKNKK